MVISSFHQQMAVYYVAVNFAERAPADSDI